LPNFLIVLAQFYIIFIYLFNILATIGQIKELD